MNALYVTVSIPLLLVLAGFNHAHGLTTFGKTNNQGTQQPQPVQAKSCVTQANCTLIKGTTCLKGFCFCGDNTHPINGVCKAKRMGPRHICNTSDDCVEGAECMDVRNKTRTGGPDKICLCQEGLTETQSGLMCGAQSNFMVLPGLTLIILALTRTFT